jgi:hypothetical protein
MATTFWMRSCAGHERDWWLPAEAVHATSANVEGIMSNKRAALHESFNEDVSWRGPWMLATGQQSAVSNQAAGGLVVVVVVVVVVVAAACSSFMR